MENKIENFHNINMTEVSKTLLLPLTARAREMEREKPLFKDLKAKELLSHFNTEGMIIDGGDITTQGIISRIVVIDGEVRKIAENSDRTVVINLGAGLDTRYSRLAGCNLIWYDLDLPEVIGLRQRLIGSECNTVFIAKSILDESWVNDINIDKGSEVIIIAEGLLMYFTEDEVRRILDIITNAFPEAHFLFDAVHSYFINRKISSEFKWGINKPSDINELNKKLEIKKAWFNGDLLKERQPVILRLVNIMPATRRRGQIIYAKIQ